MVLTKSVLHMFRGHDGIISLRNLLEVCSLTISRRWLNPLHEELTTILVQLQTPTASVASLDSYRDATVNPNYIQS